MPYKHTSYNDHTHLCFRSYVEQVEAEYVGRYVGVLGVVPEDTHTPTLGELVLLVVKILWEKRMGRGRMGGRKKG